MIKCLQTYMTDDAGHTAPMPAGLIAADHFLWPFDFNTTRPAETRLV